MFRRRGRVWPGLCEEERDSRGYKWEPAQNPLLSLLRFFHHCRPAEEPVVVLPAAHEPGPLAACDSARLQGDQWPLSPFAQTLLTSLRQQVGAEFYKPWVLQQSWLWECWEKVPTIDARYFRNMVDITEVHETVPHRTEGESKDGSFACSQWVGVSQGASF